MRRMVAGRTAFAVFLCAAMPLAPAQIELRSDIGGKLTPQQIAANRMRSALNRLALEAAAYAQLAPQVTGEETLRLRVLKPPPKFKPRIGDAATKPPQAQWVDRAIISLYAVSLLGGSLHEIRQVMFVDGRKVQDERSAQRTLTELVTGSADQQKYASIKQLQKYTYGSAAVDFGPLILLFTQRGQERYEFTPIGPRALGTVASYAYRFRQLDGTEGFTLFAGLTRQLRLEGEVWISDDPQGPIRISLGVDVPKSEPSTREEAEVDYTRSAFGALLPLQIEQREVHGPDIASENIFNYANFQKLPGR
jgi:hypothetical protein